MAAPYAERFARAARRAAGHFKRPENLAFVPALTLAAYWLGGEHALVLAALTLPLLFFAVGAFRVTPSGGYPGDGPMRREELVDRLDAALKEAAQGDRNTACLVLRLDDMGELIDRYGHAAHSHILQRSVERLEGALREGDCVAKLEGDGFAVALAAVRQIDLESILQLAARLQAVVANPISLDAARVYVSASVGFCLGNRAAAPGGAALLEAAEIAADDAARNGPVAIRAFSAKMQRIHAGISQLRGEIERALDQGHIGPYFQPQVSTGDGSITGFEALARWNHPQRGLIPPSEFLPLIESASLSERLGEVMLFQALAALSAWDSAGLNVPSVAVNFSRDQLRNPRLPETLAWDLDRFELAPERLCVEILETVVAKTENDVIVRNVAALARLGCGIDLDDFGTGHASIANIRRFAVRRIKIDRSFVTHVDSDPQQQRMVSAILSMAERLGLEALAEGVETAGEHTMLAQLGCSHVQGYGLARPMPVEDTAAWIKAYRGRLTAQPRLGRHAV